MAIIKRSEAQIDSVFDNSGEMLREVVSRSLLCARCGEKLDPDAQGPIVACASCGYQTPRMVERSVSNEQ